MDNKYYLYRHIRLDKDEPFYIGIGSSEKYAKYKRAYSVHSRNSHWKNVVSCSKYEVEILLESDDYEFIKQKEIEFIALYGRKDLGLGPLCNWTDGGEGTLGTIMTPEKRIAYSNGAKKQVWTEERRAKARESMKLANKAIMKTVYQYSLDGNFIREFESIAMASNVTDINESSIAANVIGTRQHTAGKYIWFSKFMGKQIEPYKVKRRVDCMKSVSRYNLNGDYIDTFNSITDAVKVTGAAHAAIYRCCNEKAKTAVGFKWKYKD